MRSLTTLAVLFLTSVTLEGSAAAHGGAFPQPPNSSTGSTGPVHSGGTAGGTVTLGSGGGSTGGPSTGGPSTGSPTGGTGGPAWTGGADTASPTGQTAPGRGAISGGPPNVGPSPSAAPQAPPVSALGFLGSPDLSHWTLWWHFNQAPYLDLRRAVHAGGVETGSDEFFLGHGKEPAVRGSLRPTQAQIRERILPLLLAALEGDPQPDVAASALIALAKAGRALDDFEAVRIESRLRTWLSARNQLVSECAALSLAILARPTSIPLLRSLALDSPAGRVAVGRSEVSARTRAFAAYGLGLIGGESAEPALRQSIAATLVELVEAPSSPTPDLQAAAVLALGLVPVEPAGGRGNPEQRAGLPTRAAEARVMLALLADARAQRLVRAQAPIALARLVPAEDAELWAEAVRRLAALLDPRAAERAEVERGAAVALGRLVDLDGDPHDRLARRALLQALAEAKDAMVVRYAAISLGRIGGRPGTGEEPSEGYREVRKALLERLARGGATPVRPWAALALGVLQRARIDARLAPDPEISAALRASLAECRSTDQVGAYALAVGLGRDPDGAPLLAEALERFADDDTKGYLALALGLCGERDRQEPLRAIVDGARFRPTLLGQASIGLALLGDKALVPALVAELGSSRSLASQASLATALGRIGDARSVEPLVALLRSEEVTAAARAFAAVALGIVADPRALPFNVELTVDSNYASATPVETDPSGTGVLDIL